MNYLIAAYAAMWLILFFYLLTLGKRQHTLEEKLAQIEQKLQTPGEGSSRPPGS